MTEILPILLSGGVIDGDEYCVAILQEVLVNPASSI